MCGRRKLLGGPTHRLSLSGSERKHRGVKANSPRVSLTIDRGDRGGLACNARASLVPISSRRIPSQFTAKRPRGSIWRFHLVTVCDVAGLPELTVGNNTVHVTDDVTAAKEIALILGITLPFPG
jgi:hypothetical protein